MTKITRQLAILVHQSKKNNHPGFLPLLMKSLPLFCLILYSVYIQRTLDRRLYSQLLQLLQRSWTKIAKCICLSSQISFLLLNHSNILPKASTCVASHLFVHHIYLVHPLHNHHPIISLNTFHILIFLLTDTHSFTSQLPHLWNPIPIINLHLACALHL